MTQKDEIELIEDVKRLHVPPRAVALKQALKACQTLAPQGKTEPCKLNIDKPLVAELRHTEPYRVQCLR